MSGEMKTESKFEAEEMTNPRVVSPGSQSSHPARFVGMRSTLPSDINIVAPFVDQLMRFISKFRIAEGDNFGIELALREALVNAIVHGNQEDSYKRVYVNCRCSADGEVSIEVQDEGLGFNHEAVPDPTSPDNRLLTHGRGLYLMRKLMDKVDFERGGSVVRMRKRANASSDATRKPQ